MAGNNYSFVIDSSFNPLSLQEVLTPLVMYKDAYEESENTYNELTQKADTFKYLADRFKDNPDSKAAQIYKGYADELSKQASDLAAHGLSMNNRRALTNLKRRYQGEIGLLDKAYKAMEEERKLRRTNKDNSMLYAVDNLNIDQFLNDETPNLYSVSGNELYQRGALIGKNFSSRVFQAGDAGRTLGGYYRDYVTRMGYTPEQLARFSDEILEDFTSKVSALPELQQAAQSLLDATGASTNLTGNALRQAQHQVIRGMVDNAIYEEKHNPVRDVGVISAAENLSAASQGLELKNGKWTYNPDLDPSIAKARVLAELKNNRNSNNKGASTDKKLQLSNKIRIEWEDDPETSKYKVIELDDTSTSTDGYDGEGVIYGELPDNIKRAVDKILEGSDPNLYHYYYVPWESGTINDTEASVDIIPYKVITTNNDSEDASASFGE